MQKQLGQLSLNSAEHESSSSVFKVFSALDPSPLSETAVSVGFPVGTPSWFFFLFLHHIPFPILGSRLLVPFPQLLEFYSVSRRTTTHPVTCFHYHPCADGPTPTVLDQTPLWSSRPGEPTSSPTCLLHDVKACQVLMARADLILCPLTTHPSCQGRLFSPQVVPPSFHLLKN